MGRSIALTLAREGAKVVVNYRTSEESAGAIVEHIVAGGGEAIAVQADVFDGGDCKRLVDAALGRFGRIDICVIGPGAGWHPDPIEKLNAGAALKDAEQELAPIYHLLPLVLPGMYERKWGRIIGLALHPTELPPAYAYNAAKAARAQALLLAQGPAWKQGVTVNIIAPGPVAAIESLEKAVEQCEGGPAWRDRADVSPQDIAETVAFLCSDAASYITGCVVPFAFR
jgi:NAD(P)-dependent dehydrogenase (short-subunit alcohol dehydrogenase family)